MVQPRIEVIFRPPRKGQPTDPKDSPSGLRMRYTLRSTVFTFVAPTTVRDVSEYSSTAFVSSSCSGVATLSCARTQSGVAASATRAQVNAKSVAIEQKRG